MRVRVHTHTHTHTHTGRGSVEINEEYVSPIAGACVATAALLARLRFALRVRRSSNVFVRPGMAYPRRQSEQHSIFIFECVFLNRNGVEHDRGGSGVIPTADAKEERCVLCKRSKCV